MIKIIGTAHISRESIKKVEDTIRREKPDIVAVELCESRYKALTEEREIPVVELIKQKKAMIFLANTLLSFLQRKMGEEVGVEPGKEMLRAIEVANELGIDIALIDRDIRITLKRALSKMSFFEKLRLIKELLLAYGAEKKEIEEELEKINREEELFDILEDFKTLAPQVYEVLVNERDAYMAHKLLELDVSNVSEKRSPKIIAVVGAGHKRGIEHYLNNPEEIPDINELLRIPEKKISLSKIIKYGLPMSIIAMFIIAFYKGISLRNPLGLWALNHMIPTFIAVIIARGSLPSAIVGMLASPLTSLNPLIAAGWFAGLVELKVRKVTVNDITQMFKVNEFGELIKNKAFRVLLVTAFANIGSMLGTFISFPTIILPLLRKIFGG